MICVIIGSAMATVADLDLAVTPQHDGEGAGAGDQQGVERRSASDANRVLSRSEAWKRPVCWSTASRT